jgi:hypothetical protein
MTNRSFSHASGYARWIMGRARQRMNMVRPLCAAAYLGIRQARYRWRTDIGMLGEDLGKSLRPLIDYGMRRFERAQARLSTEEERRRINRELEEYGRAGVVGIDLLRAAAIWAGAGPERYTVRRIRYKVIAAAIRRGDIRGAVQRGGDGPGPDVYTRMPLRELRNYFIRIGVLTDESNAGKSTK